MSMIRGVFRLACLAAVCLLIFTSAVRASSEPSVRVTSAVGPGVVRLNATASGPFGFIVHHPSPNLYYIDMTGVSAPDSGASQVLNNDLLRSYRLEEYQSGNQTVSRIAILLGHGATPKITREGSNALRITVSQKDVVEASAQSPVQVHIVDAALHTTASPKVIIHQISVAKNDGTAEVLVLGSGVVNYHEMRLSHPDRLVLDFQSGVMFAAKKTASDVAPIRDVRAAQFSPQVARVVIDLTKSAPFSVKRVKGGVAIEFASAESASASGSSSSIPLASDSAAAASASSSSAQAGSSSAPSESSSASNSTESASSSAPSAPTQPSTPSSATPESSSAGSSSATSEASTSSSTGTSSSPSQTAQPSASSANTDNGSAPAAAPASSSSNFPQTTQPMSSSPSQPPPTPSGFEPTTSSQPSGAASPTAPSATAENSAANPQSASASVTSQNSASAAAGDGAASQSSNSASAPAAAPSASSSSAAASASSSEASPAAASEAPAQAAAESSAPAQPAPAGTVMPAPAAASASPVSVISQDQSSTKYTGAPISVNLKNVDLQDFFRLIHEISGLNVVVDPNVKGTLTLVLDNVPWDQALDIVLKNNDLADQLQGNVLRIATKATLRHEAEQARELAKAQLDAADLVTTTRTLSYAKASDMVNTLKKFLSPRGTILADDRTNTLVISDIPSVLPVIDNLIRELDTRTQQVEIEARVVAANRTFARELGSEFAFAGSATGGRNLFGGVGAVGTSPISRFTPPLPAPPVIVGTTAPTGTSPTAVNMPLVTNLGTSVPTSGVSYAFSSANFALDYIIDAAESKGVGKLLSKPKEIVQNNEEATIKQGTKIPVQTVINNTISVQFIDAVLELQVTPQITRDGTIFMKIHVENTQIDPAIPRIQGIPALDTQAQDTQVLVADGQTVMIGGIIVSNQQTSIDEVPFVGSLPIIGQLFRHTSISTNSQELLFFVTPRILPM